MCGRYNFSVEEAEEIRKIVEEVNEKLNGPPIKTGEIYPTNYVPVLLPGDVKPEPDAMSWGFPNFAVKSKSAVVINARSETVLEKRMFKESVLLRRCVVPSTGFYEWDRADGQKIKYLFHTERNKVLYMAGIWNTYRDSDGTKTQRFVILTTEANRSMCADTKDLTLFPDESQERLIHNRISANINQVQTYRAGVANCCSCSIINWSFL